MQEPGLKLKQAEKEALDALMRWGRHSVRVLKRARTLPPCVREGWTGVAELARTRWTGGLSSQQHL